MKKEISIYVHIPFCKRKCLYCDFLSGYAKESVIDRYFDALEREIRGAAGEYGDYEVKTIFFGGGTPSFPGAELICRMLSAIGESFSVSEDAEISIEVNPASAMYEKLKAYREAGFNRLSIGVQSLNDAELRTLGRLHDQRTALKTFEDARAAGFKNINIDMMSALPGQDIESYLATLMRVAELEPEHISAYSLIVEEGTPFYDMKLDLPDEETDRLMYHETKRLLAEHGYKRYEISNYSREGFECRHNKVYWRRGDYLGLGIGAASMVDNIRWNNTRELDRYISCLCPSGSNNSKNAPAIGKDTRWSSTNDLAEHTDSICSSDNSDSKNYLTIRENKEELSLKSRMEEFMFLGLRLCEGVSAAEFKRQFGEDIFNVYRDVIAKYESMGLLQQDYRETSSGPVAFLSLTDRGLDVSNTVMADFLL